MRRRRREGEGSRGKAEAVCPQILKRQQRLERGCWEKTSKMNCSEDEVTRRDIDVRLNWRRRM